jgi:MATE family multidrug resistance protein
VRGGYGAVGIWWALAAGLASAALLLGWRFYHKTRTQPGGFSRIT